MGGRGSGRRAGAQPQQCHECMRIDLAWLRRNNMLRTGAWSNLNWSRGGETSGSIQIASMPEGLRLNYRTRTGDGDWRQVNEQVPFVWTKTKFHGKRAWFQCLTCRRRCRILYGGSLFRCRRCHGLKYESQYESMYSRGLSRAYALRKRFGQFGSLDEPFVAKPKGMHWTTYRRLEALDEQLQHRWALGMRQWMQRLISEDD
jgi:hypothetical protein